MYEITHETLTVFILLGFMAGVFGTVFLTRIFEVVHMWRLFQSVLTHLLMMCITIIEQVSFLNQLKVKAMNNADFSAKQIREFEAVWEQTLSTWQDSVILSIVNRAPQKFRSMIPFKNWKEAVKFVDHNSNT
jgi:hypothetical protein